MLLALALGGCWTDATRGGPSGAAARAARPPLDLLGDAAWPAPYASDPLWRRAASGDDFQQARLARREGARALLEALELGGSLGRTALSALGYAGDRREALSELCALALDSTPATSSLLLATLYEVAVDAPSTEASVDPNVHTACATKLQQLSERQGQSSGDHDRARAALAALEQHPAAAPLR